LWWGVGGWVGLFGCVMEDGRCAESRDCGGGTL
jgi:hypothetical protein